jgi:alpha-L-rhamnosidase
VSGFTTAEQHIVKDERVRAYVNPVRIVWRSDRGVTGETGLLVGADAKCALERVAASDPPGILLDFGCELNGGVRIDSPINNRHRPVRFRIRFGESVSEAMGEPNNDHAIHDCEVLIPWMGHAEIGCTGFRFARIDLLDTDVSVELRAVRAVALYRDLPYVGSFECSDERLNEIWRVGARTVHLCLQDYLWDGIKRDRLVWAGDIHPETRVVSAVFGKLGVVEQSLDYARDSYPLPQWINGISSFSIWWIIAQADWYKYHGDLAYLDQQRGYLVALADMLGQRIDESGHETLDGHRFLDWPTSEDQDAISAGLHALLVIGLRAAAELLRALGEEDAAVKALRCAQRAASFADAASACKQVSALRVLADTLDPQVANESYLSVDPCRGLSMFYGYYVLEARAKAGDYSGCLDVIRNYWGAMLDLGATTFWEHFELDWMDGAGRIDEIVPHGMRDIHADCGDYCYKGLRHSLCHGWAGSPTAWLSEHVLGVTPIQPGFRTVKIDPNLGDLQWARGTMPTPLGVIEVFHEVQGNGLVKTEIAAPDGVGLVETS